MPKAEDFPTMTYDVFTMCNALYDVQALVDYAVLEKLGLTPGGMHLVDETQHRALMEHVQPYIANAAAGGSGANTAIGIAGLGGRACYTSRVGADAHGRNYVQSLVDHGVEPLLAQGTGATGTCLVLVTPDGERTMCTFLGEGRNLQPQDVSVDHIRLSRMLYFTAYLWDTVSQKEAVLRALSAARQAGVTVAMSLADRFCVERHRDDLLQMVGDGVQVVFGNEDEACLLMGVDDAIVAAKTLAAKGVEAFVTLGARGAVVAHHDAVERVPGISVQAVDTTGAGDAFAAAVLYGRTHGLSPADAAALGCALAASVVARLGPRPLPEDAARLTEERRRARAD